MSSQQSNEDFGSECETGPAEKRIRLSTIKYDQKYNKLWEADADFKSWISASSKSNLYAFCKICKVDITIKSGKYQLARHMKSDKHKNNMIFMSAQPTLRSLVLNNPITKLATQTKDAEIYLAAFVAEHNLSLRVMEHLPQLIKTIVPDSEIAKRITSSRTKTSCVIKNVLGKEAEDNLISNMKEQLFSIVIDESTDKACKKHLCVVVRLADSNFSVIKDELFKLIPVIEADSETLFNSIVSVFKSTGILYEKNMIGFAADNASNMIGRNKSVATMFLNKIPNLFVMRCICHSFNLCASYACTKLPRGIEDMARGIYNYFSNSPKRLSRLEEFQHFVEVEPNKILQPSQTRWLSLQQVVERLLQQYEALRLFFIDAVATDRLLIANQILTQLNDPTTKLFLHFLSFVLPIFNNLNKMMQSEEPQIYNLLSSVKLAVKTIAECYLDPNYLNSRDIKDINYENPRNFLPIEKMYFGAYAAAFMSNEEQPVSAEAIKFFRLRCLDFYIEAVKQIVTRISLADPVLENLNFINPSKIRSISTIAPVMIRFPNIISSDDIQNLDTEWRLLKNVEALDFQKLTAMEFWKQVGKFKHPDGQRMFPLLTKFVFSLLSLPHSSANVERKFSIINDIKSNKRSKLGDELLTGLMYTKQLLRDSTCFEISITNSMRSRFTSDIYKNEP